VGRLLVFRTGSLFVVVAMGHLDGGPREDDVGSRMVRIAAFARRLASYDARPRDDAQHGITRRAGADRLTALTPGVPVDRLPRLASLHRRAPR
jgi:hypothetical protein